MSHRNQHPDCTTCGGRRFVRGSNGWLPCAECYWTVVGQTYIKPQIRQTDRTLPDSWLKAEPFAWEDGLRSGEYDAFRFGVWRSMLFYYGDRDRPTYDYVDAYRLVDIQFERDAEYRAVRDLNDLDLLVLVIGLADPPTDYTASLVSFITNLRRMHGRPTWVWRRSGRGALPQVGSTPIEGSGRKRLDF